MANVDLRDVSKVFDKNVIAVRSANVQIKDQEFVVLVGPSGCGKSTLLRMIAGLEEISSGEIYIDGNLVNNVPPKDRDIAMVFQNYALYPHMSVYENMAFGLKLRKYAKSEIEQRVREAAEILDITHLLHRKPKALSGGQRQRVAVGRAIVRKPKVFLFDEPLSNLDAKLRVQMRTEIAKLHSRLGTTMIYVTHDQVEAMTMGDRIVVLKDGIVQQIESPLNLYNSPKNKFVAGFIGSPAMNFIEGTCLKKGDLYFSSESVELALLPKQWDRLESHINQKLFLGIRPEDISIASSTQESSAVRKISCSIEVIEPMGNESFLYLKMGVHSVVARVKPVLSLHIGDQIEVAFDLNKTHFFDAGTEEAL